MQHLGLLVNSIRKVHIACKMCMMNYNMREGMVWYGFHVALYPDYLVCRLWLVGVVGCIFTPHEYSYNILIYTNITYI